MSASRDQPLRVLVVEDSPGDAARMLEALRDGGYSPDFVRVDSAAALRNALENSGWQIVLCACSMPSFDAMAALKIVHEHGVDVPFIVISGAADEEKGVSAMRAGAHDLLIKWRFARFIPLVERELRNAAVRAERTAMQQQLLLSGRLVQSGTLATGVAPETDEPVPPRERTRPRVLVVDDEPAIVEIVKRLLRKDYEMVGVVGGEAAVELIRRDADFSAVFCDLMMPGINGIQFYAELGRLAPHLQDRVVFLTGGAFTPDAGQFLSGVSNPRVHKPFDPKMLKAAVDDLLARTS